MARETQAAAGDVRSVNPATLEELGAVVVPISKSAAGGSGSAAIAPAASSPPS